MHKTKVSRAVAELERRRWLARRPDEQDRRMEHLMLTKAGLEAYREMVPLAKAFEQRLSRAMGAARLAEFDHGLERLEAFMVEKTRT